MSAGIVKHYGLGVHIVMSVALLVSAWIEIGLRLYSSAYMAGRTPRECVD